MGPAQSSTAWGCAENKMDYQEGASNIKARDNNQSMAAFNAQVTDEQLAGQSQHPDTEHDSHRVSIHPVYELALCRKIKETFTKGEARESTNSEIELEQLSTSLKDSETSESVVLTQPERVVSGLDIPGSKPDTSDESGLCHVAKHPSQALAESTGQSHRTSGQSNRKSVPENESERSQMDTGMVTTMLAEASPQLTEMSERSPHQNQPEAEEDHLGQVNTRNSTHPPTQTETKATQTTQTHPGDINLSLPPPRPVMISVSTPPDETSPMFYKLSQPTISHLTEDVLSSPDVESDASDVGYAHLRSRFGLASHDGGAAAAAAGGASEATVEAGRPKTRSKKKEKSIDYILRTMNNLGSAEDKLTTLCEKYTDLYEEQKGLQLLLKQHQRKMGVMQREKDQLQSEHNRAVMAKGKLETLCRELQKQNKMVKDDSLTRLKEEEEKRKQMSTKFQASLAEIQGQLEENHQRNLQLREENRGLSRRLDVFMEQHHLREDCLDHLGRQRHLELELAEARLKQASLLLQEEQEKHLKEKETILHQAAEGKKKNDILEEELKKYKDRYTEFQDTLTASGNMFQKLKTDMDKMGSRMKKLEKDGQQWKSKWEQSHRALQDVREEKAQCEQENRTLLTKVTRLESLCRALQNQRYHSGTTSDNSLRCSEDPCEGETTPTVSADDAEIASSSGSPATKTFETAPLPD